MGYKFPPTYAKEYQTIFFLRALIGITDSNKIITESYILAI